MSHQPEACLDDQPTTSSTEDLNAKKKTNIREWDFGKKGVTSTLTQEEWVDRQRNNRNTEFAPPSMYVPSKRQKNDQRGKYRESSFNRNQDCESNYSHHMKSETSSSDDTSSGCQNTEGSTNDGYKEALREERKHAFAPPSTYEYFGPNTARGRTQVTKPRYSAMEDAINKGLAHLRKMSNK